MQYFIQLRQPSVAQKLIESTPDAPAELRRREAASEWAGRYEGEVLAGQQQFLDRVRGRSLGGFSAALSNPIEMEILGASSFLLNGVFVRASPEAVESLRRDPEVLQATPARERHLFIDSAPAVVRAEAFWQAVGGVENAGAGIKIGIIDSGIHHNHAMFRGDGFSAPADFPKGSAAFTNGKVIAARSYHHLFPNFQNDQTPADERSHGTAVAGVAAGNRVSSPMGMVQGIAPRAFIGNYKVFGNPQTNPTTTSSAILAAINDAVADGMDIVNLSLGGPPADPENDPEQQAIRLGSELGVVFVVAAGNSGPAPGTVSSPGTSPDALTVGAVTHARFIGTPLEVADAPPPGGGSREIGYIKGEQVELPFGAGPFEALPVSAVSASGSSLGCQPLPAGSLLGRAALVERGECLFQVKAENAIAAGASAMVVFNNVGGPPIVMNLCPEGGAQCAASARPSGMISRQDGLELQSRLAGGERLWVSLAPAFQNKAYFLPGLGDHLTNFSGRGPGFRSAIKPDLSAPGDAIFSASNTGAFSFDSRGTSFSTPIVAGAAALIRQLHPDWTVGDVKSALVHSAQSIVTVNGAPAGVLESGAGRLDMEAASATVGTADPVSISFGVFHSEEEARDGRIRSVRVRNASASPRTFLLTVEQRETVPSLQLSVFPPTLHLEAGQAQEVLVQATGGPTAAMGAFEGRIIAEDAFSGRRIAIPYWGAISVEIGSLVKVSQEDGNFSDLNEAVLHAVPGGVVEIADSGTYRTNLSLQFNRFGVALDGLTIRAASDASPVLEGDSPSAPTIAVTGLERVTLDGLHVRGQSELVAFRNASGTLKRSLLEGTGQDEDGFGLTMVDSRVHIFDNVIEKTSATAIASFQSTSLIQRNRIRGLRNPQGGHSHAILLSADSRSSIFDNRIEGSREASVQGQGIRISGGLALVKGNSILWQGGAQGDGVLIRSADSSAWLLDNWIASNERHGIGLFDGAQASASRNVLSDNSELGMAIHAGSRAWIEANRIFSNGGGVGVFDSEASVVDSVIAFSTSAASGHGILAQDSALQLVHATVAGNRGVGLLLAGSGSVLAANSILSGNAAGDLSGVRAQDDIRSNLIQDGSLSGTAGNMAADPEFASAKELDFSLQAGSPSIDAGDAALSLTSLDLLSRVRPVDGTGDGIARADLGAVEFASEASEPIHLPVLSTRPDEFLGIAFTNAHRPAAPLDFSESEAHAFQEIVRMRAFLPSGELFAEQQLAVGSLVQQASLLTEFFPNLNDGWIEIASSGPDTVGFTLLGTSDLRYLDGAILKAFKGETLLLPEIRTQAGEDTSLLLVNPESEPQTAALRLVSPNGVQEQSAPLAPNGMSRISIKEFFGAGVEGYLEATPADGFRLGAIQLFGTAESIGGLAGIPLSEASNELFGAQLAVTPEMDTLLNVVNWGPGQSVSLEAVDESGTVLAWRQEELQQGEQLRISAREFFGLQDQSLVGWLRIHTADARLLGSVSFQDPDGRFLASLPLQNRPAREVIFSHVAHTDEIFTGVALLNPHPAPALIALDVFDSHGALVGTALRELRAGQKLARLIHEWVPELERQGGGFIRVRASHPIFGFALFGAPDLRYLAAVPQQTLVH
ncbi:MAG TPA: S8 family serine peptidase [Acidobacteriota bacterium]|nr:S8 family serine peptidase [Acidobacteriota bacterium]